MSRAGLSVRDWVGARPTAAIDKLIERAESLGIALDFVSPVTFQETWERIVRYDPRASALGTPYDHRVCKLDEDNSVFIIGSVAGFPVCTQAIRLHRFGQSNLAAQANRLTLFFDDPKTQAHPADYAICNCLSAPLITGDCARPGATWVRKDYTGDKDGQRLSQSLGRLVRAMALNQWDPGFSFSFVGEALNSAGQMRSVYGYSREEGGMRMRLQSIDQDAVLLWMPRDELIADLASVVRGELRRPEAV